jgi:sulfur relay (sulfurtransferase) DsrF/TusC family protein
VKKRILVTIHHPPFGSMFFSEGLRAAVGISSGLDEHLVDLLFMGDGVFCGLKDADYKDLQRFFMQLRSVSSSFFLEEEALGERGLKPENVSSDFKILSRREIVGKLKEYDFNLDY